MDYKITSFESGGTTSAISYTYTIEKKKDNEKDGPIDQFVVEYSLPFLRIAAIFVSIIIIVCILFNYLSLRSNIVKLSRQVGSLEQQLEKITVSNQDEYDRIMNNINMEEIRDRAMEDGRMIYPFQAQTVTVYYDENDYVRQYKDFE